MTPPTTDGVNFLSGIISKEEASGEIQGSLLNGEPPCGKEVIALRSKPQKRKKVANKKQRRDYLPLISHLAAALYWVLRLVLLLWDRFAG